MTSKVEVLATGPLTTVQDRGRQGHAALGVPSSGAVDRASYHRANRLVGNQAGAAVLEVTFGGLVLRALGPVWIGTAGAPCDVAVDNVPVGFSCRVFIGSGSVLRLGVPSGGVRTYVAVRGGFDFPFTLGSRSTDTLAGLGPAPIGIGDVLPVTGDVVDFPAVDQIPVRSMGRGPIRAAVLLGPRDDWFTSDAVDTLRSGPWLVSATSNRVGVRLDGPVLERAVSHELPSEGVPVGAVQVPPSGPIVFLDDHPVTGGYPVIGVVPREGVDRIAQARPGQSVVFDVRRGPRPQHLVEP